jgi:hypothetical protein
VSDHYSPQQAKTAAASVWRDADALAKFEMGALDVPVAVAAVLDRWIARRNARGAA